MHNYKETLEWYETHQTEREIGFNPDGMCLRVVRTARDADALYGSALESQRATPEEHRVYKIRDLRKGMVLYFDDEDDSNPYGHVVTQIGRVPGFDPDSLHDILVETNSVKKGQLVIVRGDYFQRYWGDEFKFGATWLNGQTLDIPQRKPVVPQELQSTLVQQFRRSAPDWDVTLLDRAVENRGRHLRKYVEFIETTVESLSEDNNSDPRVREFITNFETRRVLSLRLLNVVVEEGNAGQVKQTRNVLRQIIKSLPEK